MNNKCIIVLSEKSSGSSALQNLLSDCTSIKHLAKTRHYENESLYWVKAASVLGMDQKNMLSSEVPIPINRAKRDILNLLNDNLGRNFSLKEINKDFLFHGWELLCEQYSPVFIEKSPHHLLQWSSIDLIIQASKKIKNIDFLIIGLVRNPMDVIYSHYKRWGVDPDKMQYQWMRSYINLKKLQSIQKGLGFEFITLRYEDIINSSIYLKPVLEFCNVSIRQLNDSFLHQNAVTKWKNDKKYGFILSDDVFELAKEFGYEANNLINSNKLFWRVRKTIRIYFYSIAIFIKNVLGNRS